MLPPTPSTDQGKLLKTPDIQNRLKKIKILILDVDGIMTDGRIFWLNGHGWTRHFHVKDGYGLKLLMKAGIQVATISGGDSKDVRTRMEFLKIPHIFLGDEDKVKALEKIATATGLPYDEMAFMGDDLYDIPVIEKVGFSATVPQAVEPVKARVHYVTEVHGGWGAVREIADAIRVAQGLGPYLD
ncbi:MAG TPA: 3-deoxy-D-manno-octulosonate 8-phosphate phosphatase [Bdellovibrionales bacterium]|nr:3-deoxy-D-manno-octulosonate 8-phosphate phosphatase [Bdellovibrionales bacterium]HCM41352.1 3-deoxy-D-manno-octulosonate 8-phosphate phosphatase [Bdellovibrionales bacterium]